jgi:WXG100 family type VII secretion target
MAEPFRVDPDSLADALERMSGFQKLSRALLDEIDAAVKNLHIGWQGEASAAHAHRQWTHGAEQMDMAVAALQRTGTGAHTNYTQAAATNKAMWS